MRKKGLAKRDPKKQRRRALLRWLVVVVGAGVLYFLVGGKTGVVELYRIHREVHGLEVQLHEANASIGSLTVEIQRLKNDTAYIERTAREKLGMARKSETVYKFTEDQGPR